MSDTWAIIIAVFAAGCFGGLTNAAIEGAKGSGEHGAAPSDWCNGQAEDGMIGAQEGADALPVPVPATARCAEVDRAVVGTGDDRAACRRRRERQDRMAVEAASRALPRGASVGGQPDPMRRAGPQQCCPVRIVQ